MKWFRHGINFRNDERVASLCSRYGVAGYAALCIIYELLTEEGTIRFTSRNKRRIEAEMKCAGEWLWRCVSFCIQEGLLDLRDGVLYSAWLDTMRADETE